MVRAASSRARRSWSTRKLVDSSCASVRAFSASSSGLVASVDGSASSDADGSVVSYAWNWGDGSAAGSGVSSTHTYAAAGTYTITLTVTDDDGATGSTTRSVTVGGAPVVLAQDAFTKKLPVLEAYHERDLTKEQLLRRVLEAYSRFAALDSSLRIVCEDLAFQAWFRAELAEIGREIGLYPPVDGNKPRGDKHDRILSLDHLVNGGTIQFLENDPHQRAQREELKHLLSSRYHDDLAETLWGCVDRLRGGVGMPIYATTPMTGRGRLAAYLRGGTATPFGNERPDRDRLYAEREAASRTGGW